MKGNPNEWFIADLSFNSTGASDVKQIRWLSDSEVKQLDSAGQCFDRVLGRMTYSVLVQNYRAFCDLLQQLNAMAGSTNPGLRINFNILKSHITTAIVNYLTGMRMFLDHSKAELVRRDRCDDGSRFANWDATCKAEYEAYFAYRFISRFRNYVQHVGLPLSTVEISSSLNKDGSVDCNLFLGESPAQLLSRFQKWSTVRQELQELSTEIDLAEQIHISMQCLTRIAEALLREDLPELAGHVSAFEEIVGSIDAYKGSPIRARFEGSSAGAAITVVDLDGQRFRVAQSLVNA